MDDTPNLTLPYIVAAQAQKHVTHNEAIRALDALVQLAALDKDLATPPASPVDGHRYIVAASPTGAWAGQAGKVAAYQDGAWAFYSAREGWLAWVADEDKIYAWDGAAWIVAGGDVDTINPAPLVGVNTTADTTNRLSVSSPATLLNHAGSDHRLKINKSTAADTATVLFQDAFSGRAEIGLAGDDKLHVKVSADGSTWKEALLVDQASGVITMPFSPARRDTILARGTIASQLDAVIALPAGYDEIVVSLTEWVPSTASQMWLQVSTDDGATWVATGYSWAWRYFRTDPTNTSVSVPASTYIQLSGTDFPGGGVSAVLRLQNYGRTGAKGVRFDTMYGVSHPFSVVDGFGYCDAAAPWTHIRLYPGSGPVGETASMKYLVTGAVYSGAALADPAPLSRRVDCTLRNTGAGWFILQDAGHEPVGVSSVTQTADSLVLNLNFTARKVNSFIVAPDEAYAVLDKLICGASVGTTAATIQLASPTSSGAIDPATLARAAGNLWVSGVFEI